MQGLSFSQLLIIILVFFLLFGSRKISVFMSDLAKGLKVFKQVMDEDPAKEKIKQDKTDGVN